jgi:hypothetical protein
MGKRCALACATHPAGDGVAAPPPCITAGGTADISVLLTHHTAESWSPLLRADAIAVELRHVSTRRRRPGSLSHARGSTAAERLTGRLQRCGDVYGERGALVTAAAPAGSTAQKDRASCAGEVLARCTPRGECLRPRLPRTQQHTHSVIEVAPGAGGHFLASRRVRARPVQQRFRRPIPAPASARTSTSTWAAASACAAQDAT